MSSPWTNPDFWIQKIASQPLPSSFQFGHKLIFIPFTPTLHLHRSSLEVLCLLHIPKHTGYTHEQPPDAPKAAVLQQTLIPSFPPVGSLCPSTEC